MIFKKKIFLKEVDSTNDYLIKLDNNISLDEGFVVISDFQHNGRGRIGKSWDSDCGKNLLFSFILKPTFLDLRKQFFLSMITSLSIFEVLQKNMDVKINIKWPNDVLVNKKKIAGFLLDFSISSTGIKRCIIGCGININQKKFPALSNATSLSLVKDSVVNKSIILNHFLDTFSDLYKDLKDGNFDKIKKKYLSLQKGFEFTTIVNGKKSNVQILDLLEDGDVLASVNGVKEKLKSAFL